MSDRAVSTVLDVAVCLLLVSAAVATLAGAPRPSPDPATTAAAETAGVLGSTTATVNYSLAPDVRGIDGDPAFPVTEGPAFERSANGTLAGLLAAAAVANLTVDGESVSPIGDAFGAAVRNATGTLLSGPGWRGQVVAVWRPYRGAHLVGRLVVGPAPPPAADVYVARLPVSVGYPDVQEEAIAAARDGGFAGVAAAVAGGIVDGRFPSTQVRSQLQGPYPEARLAECRYERFASQYGVTASAALDVLDVERIDQRLRTAVASEVEADLRTSFETPGAAANAVQVGTVTVTVRTWSP